RHRGDEVPFGIADVRIDRGRVPKEVRLPLIRVAADEPEEVLEAHPARPLVERSGLARLEGWRVVVLPEPGRRVAVVPEDRADRRLLLRDDAVVAGEARRLLRDHAEAHRVVVAPGDEGRAAGRAEGRRV